MKIDGRQKNACCRINNIDNYKMFSSAVKKAIEIESAKEMLLYDAQTSVGLLISVAEKDSRIAGVDRFWWILRTSNPWAVIVKNCRGGFDSHPSRHFFKIIKNISNAKGPFCNNKF
jgi:hypothetical protein